MKTIEQIMRQTYLERIEHFKGDFNKVAKTMGVTVKTVYNHLHKFNIFDEVRKMYPGGQRGRRGNQHETAQVSQVR